jgi:hypothetical protein
MQIGDRVIFRAELRLEVGTVLAYIMGFVQVLSKGRTYLLRAEDCQLYPMDL